MSVPYSKVAFLRPGEGMRGIRVHTKKLKVRNRVDVRGHGTIGISNDNLRIEEVGMVYQRTQHGGSTFTRDVFRPSGWETWICFMRG